MDFLNLKPPVFGIDISDLSLKIIKLRSRLGWGAPFTGRGGLELASFGETPIRPGIFKGAQIKDHSALVKIIKKALNQVQGGPLKTKDVVASLPEQKAFLEVIQMPKMKPEEVKNAVRFEAENYIPLPIEQVYFDSKIIPPVQDNLDHLDVLIAAFPKNLADSFSSCLKEVGLIPRALEIESQSIARALVKDRVSFKPLLLIDLGATKTSFIVFSGHCVRFTSSIPVSSQGFTEAISKNLKVSSNQAEQLKIKYGISQEEEGGERIFEALIPALTDLMEQIQTYLEYYRTHAFHEHLPPDGKEVDQILISGGGANLKGLPEFLGSELNIPVKLGNPWVNILSQDLKQVPELSFRESLKYTTALGLALRGAQERE